MNYYLHHIGDFKKDTNYLNHRVRSIYLEMMWLYYDKEKPLPNDVAVLAMKCQAEESEIKMLLNLFFTEKKDGWHHGRIDEELQKTYQKSEAARQKALKRWGNAKAMPQHSNSNANGMQPKTQDPVPKTQEYSDEFTKFWKAYPNPVKKDYCWSIWKKQKLDTKLDVVLKHLDSYKNCKKWRDGFIEHPSTYLNQKVYLDPIVSKNNYKGRTL